MSRLIHNLRRLDRKERFAVLREVLGFDREAPCLATCFRDKLGTCIGVEVPERAFLAMDFHLDWIQLALHLSENSGIEPGSTFRNPGLPDFNKTQEDIDLLVAFEGDDAGQAITYLVLIEAKAYLSWNNPQLKSKTARLGEIFGPDGNRHRAVRPRFALMTGRKPKKICTARWPAWTRKGADPLLLDYELPGRIAVTRRTEDRKRSRDGDHLHLRRTPSPEK